MDSQHSNTSPQKRRGIQPGQNVGAGAPRNLESTLHQAIAQLLADPEIQMAVPEGFTLDWVRGVSREELHSILVGRGVHGMPEANHLIGYHPDGGIFRLSGYGHTTHLLASEAKHQQNRGNAIERWFKNYISLILVAPRLACVVFATGEGAAERGVICNTLNGAFVHHAVVTGNPVRQFNQGYLEGPSVFTKAEGFQVADMVAALKEILINQLRIHHLR